jgi:hypothetical protein
MEKKKTDYDAIAKGFVELLDSNEKAILSFGMIPHKKFKQMMDIFFDVYAEKAVAEGQMYEGWSKEDVLSGMDKKWMSVQEHEISIAVYRHGNLIV